MAKMHRFHSRYSNGQCYDLRYMFYLHSNIFKFIQVPNYVILLFNWSWFVLNLSENEMREPLLFAMIKKTGV